MISNPCCQSQAEPYIRPPSDYPKNNYLWLFAHRRRAAVWRFEVPKFSSRYKLFCRPAAWSSVAACRHRQTFSAISTFRVINLGGRR